MKAQLVRIDDLTSQLDALSSAVSVDSARVKHLSLMCASASLPARPVNPGVGSYPLAVAPLRAPPVSLPVVAAGFGQVGVSGLTRPDSLGQQTARPDAPVGACWAAATADNVRESSADASAGTMSPEGFRCSPMELDVAVARASGGQARRLGAPGDVRDDAARRAAPALSPHRGVEPDFTRVPRSTSFGPISAPFVQSAAVGGLSRGRGTAGVPAERSVSSALALELAEGGGRGPPSTERLGAALPSERLAGVVAAGGSGAVGPTRPSGSAPQGLAPHRQAAQGPRQEAPTPDSANPLSSRPGVSPQRPSTAGRRPATAEQRPGALGPERTGAPSGPSGLIGARDSPGQARQRPGGLPSVAPPVTPVFQAGTPR